MPYFYFEFIEFWIYRIYLTDFMRNKGNDINWSVLNGNLFFFTITLKVCWQRCWAYVEFFIVCAISFLTLWSVKFLWYVVQCHFKNNQQFSLEILEIISNLQFSISKLPFSFSMVFHIEFGCFFFIQREIWEKILWPLFFKLIVFSNKDLV